MNVKLIAELPTPFHDADEFDLAVEEFFEPALDHALHKVRRRLFVLQKLLVNVECEDEDLIVAGVGFELPEELEDVRGDLCFRRRNRFLRGVLILALMLFVVVVILASILMLFVVVQILLRELLKRRCRGGRESATGRSADTGRAGLAQVVCS